MEAGLILTKKKKRYAGSTIKSIRNSIKRLQEFDPSLSQDKITIDTYNRFLVWANESDHSRNYTGTIIKNWKVLGTLIGGNTIYSHPDFKKIDEEAAAVYLAEPEIERMAKVTVPNTSRIARDWFIIQCCTGLRVSDLVRLSKDNLSTGMISIITQKTGEKVSIPVHRFVKPILKKYKGFPPPVTDVEINREIKVVAKLAKITGKFLSSKNKGGKRIDEKLEKWQLLVSHTARRSFITNARKNGVPDSIVMKLAGIVSPNTLKRYDRLTADEAGKIAAQLEFFK